MNEVVLTIGRRSYAVACAPGQNDHVRAMGAEVDARLRRLGANVSSNDAKNLLFAALILADELFEMKQKADSRPAPDVADPFAETKERVLQLEEALADAREEHERLQQHLANVNERLAGAEGVETGAPADADRLATRLEEIAAALERSALELENGTPTP